MSAKPRVLDQHREVNGRTITAPTARGGCIEIGRAYVRPPMPVQGHAVQVQAALLDPRTAIPPTALHRLLGAIWSFA